MPSYEPSEITTAVALMYTEPQLKKYSENKSSLKSLIVDAKKKLKSTKVVEFGSQTIETGFIKELDENKDSVITDMAIGISATRAIRKEVKNVKKVYMTGDTWPKDVQKFKVDAYGFKDYNSSDIIVTGDRKKFLGVSLKKKNKVKAPDPTMINKAFDSALDEKELSPKELTQVQNLKKDVAKVRQEFFANIVISAVDKGIILWSDIRKGQNQSFKNKQEWDRWKKSDAGEKELFESKFKDTKLFGKYFYIDTKGYANHKNGYLDTNTKDKNSMRYYVNSVLSNPRNKLWKAFLKVMNDYSDIFADILINIILKTQLNAELKKKDIDENNFQFFLITGIGNVTTKGDVSIVDGDSMSLQTTLCGLERIEKRFKNKKYEIVLDEQQQKNSSAAKLFFKIKRGNINILDLELRYKGSFKPQPQFQGTINKEFKQLLIKECS